MSVLIWLVPMALGLGLTGLFAFLWSLRHNQYDDLEGAGLRILDDDDLAEPTRRTPERSQAVIPGRREAPGPESRLTF